MPHMKRLYGAAYRLTGNAADAEDLVQETFLRAFRRFHLFIPGSNARPRWMRDITVPMGACNTLAISS